MIATFVVCLTSAPFCPTIVVGIERPFAAEAHRPFGVNVASAESGPSGRFASKLVIGASGTVPNVLEVILGLRVDVRFAGEVDRHAVALQDEHEFRILCATVGDEVARAFQRHRQHGRVRDRPRRPPNEPARSSL